MQYDHRFFDKKGRAIDFSVDQDLIKAFYNGKRIGDFSLRIEEYPMGEELIHADVIYLEEHFQSAGIGSEMVRLAFEINGRMITPPATYYADREKRNSMSEQGYQLMVSCQKKGWVGPFPNTEEPLDERDE